MRRGADILARLVEGLATACFIGFFLAILGQVATRYLGAGLVFTEELARLLNIYVVFLGLVVITRVDGHIRIDLVDRLLESRPALAVPLKVTYLLLALLFTVILFVGSWQIMVSNWGWRLATMPWLHQGHIYLAPALGSAMTVPVLLVRIAETVADGTRRSADTTE